ncbi:hypothetical protein [Streptomyces sp. NBC_01013]|uniref:hypothetical protein n=1 Tax=Streptomyces sp. NBC_01013 TaxID=2903718 RepID=UPI00386FFB0A|nr:hypothetical protein OG538_36085 [Streptomyces sp. NBC_01013]
MNDDDRTALPRRATWWCRVTGTAALAAGALTTLCLLFPTPESGVGSDLVVRYAALTALLTTFWWVGALLAPPLILPPLSAEPGRAAVPARLPRRRRVRATLVPGLMLSALPLVVARTIGAHAGPLAPAMNLITVVAGFVSLYLLRLWVVSLFAAGGPHAGPAELRRDAAAGTVAARRVRVGKAQWDGEGNVTWLARRLSLTADDQTFALRTADENNTAFRWLDLEPGIALEGRYGWLCWAAAGGSWGEPTEAMGAALVTDDGYVVWGATDRYAAESAYAPEHARPTTARRVRRAPRSSQYRAAAHLPALAMAAATLLALVMAERGPGPDAVAWILALVAAYTGVRGIYRFTEDFDAAPGPGWVRSASARTRHTRQDP